jgi:hypothetical protein
MKLSGLFLSSALLLALSGCAVPSASGLSLGDVEDCAGITVVVNYGVLSNERDVLCVDLAEDTALAKEVMAFAGYDIEGTGTYGDQVVCRVNGLPSDSEAFTIEGEEPHLESCADMPPAFAYWALWQKSTPDAPWAYAEEGVGTLELRAGQTIGVVFSTGGDTPTPSEG